MTKRLNLPALALLATSLAACGGGSGSDNPPSTPPTPDIPKGSSGDSGTLDSANYTGNKLAIFNAINEARAKAGLAPVKQNTKLDTAAQGHANYQRLNAVSGHYQTKGKPGFTGEDPSARAKAASYPDLPQIHIGEGISPSGPVRDTDHGEPISRLLSTIYHRTNLLSPNTVDVGVSINTLDRFHLGDGTWYLKATIINYGIVIPTQAIKNEAGYWVWPYDGATNLRPSYAETPNPAPDLSALGYAISLTVNPGDRITVDTFTINCAGQALPARIITATTDIHQLLDASWAFLQPEVALPYGATCVAAFAGASEKLGRINKTWSFTTTSQP